MKPSFKYTAGLLALLLFAGSAFYYFFFFLDVERGTDIPKVRPLPNLAFKNYVGEKLQTADLRGRNILINSWASWCPFCRDELFDFILLGKEYQEQELMVLAVNRAETQETARAFTDKLGSTSVQFLLDSEDLFYKSIGGFSMPETIFVDKEGNIVFHKRGPMELEEMRRRVDELFYRQ